MAGDKSSGSALLSGALSAVPVIGSVASTLLQNSNNIKLAREQREWDYRMWKENNAYNSPQAQKQRLQDAGFNPALALTNGAMSSGVSNSPSGGQTAPVTDFSPIAHGVRDSVELYQQRRMQDAQIENLQEQTFNQSIKNRFENQRQIIELDKLLSEKNLSDAQREYYTVERNRLVEENKWIDKRNSSNIHKTMMEAYQAQESGRYQRLMSTYQSMVNDFTPKQQEKILKNLDAEYEQIMSAALANDASAAASYASAALSNAQKNGVEIDNDTKDRMKDSIVKKAFEEANMIEDDNERKWLQEMHASTGKAGEYLPHAGRAYYSQQGYVKFMNKRKFRK